MWQLIHTWWDNQGHHQSPSEKWHAPGLNKESLPSYRQHGENNGVGCLSEDTSQFLFRNHSTFTMAQPWHFYDPHGWLGPGNASHHHCFWGWIILRPSGCIAIDSLWLFKDKLVAQPLGEQTTSRPCNENLMCIPWAVAWAASARSGRFSEQSILGEGTDLSPIHTSTYSVHYPNIMETRLCDPKI